MPKSLYDQDLVCLDLYVDQDFVLNSNVMIEVKLTMLK